jgi:hypothetical protein
MQHPRIFGQGHIGRGPTNIALTTGTNNSREANNSRKAKQLQGTTVKARRQNAELEFLKSPWGLGTEEE